MTSSWNSMLSEHQYDDGIFCIGRTHGFLPNPLPLERLPESFGRLQDVLDALPAHLPDGGAGLLAQPVALERAVHALPDLHAETAALSPTSPEDIRTIAALFRGYTFLASAYTLEPAHRHQQQHGSYGEARRRLPPQIARPLARVASRLAIAPWLDYHYAYALNNWAWKNSALPPQERMHWTNLRMCVAFSGTTDEAGFILLHVHINSFSGQLLSAFDEALDAAQRLSRGESAAPDLRVALADALEAMRSINEVRKEMWKASRWGRYNDFRVFLMGIEGNTSIFGEGVVYEGVEEYGEAPQRFRGQTGAQDDIVPAADVMSGVEPWYPDNELTRYLRDLRHYRPLVVRRWLSDLRRAVSSVSLHDHVDTDPQSLALLLLFVEEIYLFRNGHWQLVQKYILASTRYSVATGGTPVTAWIPNQIEATLARMRQLLSLLSSCQDGLPRWLGDEVTRVRGMHQERCALLRAQIEELAKSHFDAKLVYDLNGALAEGPSFS